MKRRISIDELQTTLISLNDAIELVIDKSSPLPTQTCDINNALNLVLAEDVTSAIDIPTQPSSTMDGYAISAAVTQSASDATPVAIKKFEKIMTGWPLPMF